MPLLSQVSKFTRALAPYTIRWWGWTVVNPQCGVAQGIWRRCGSGVGRDHPSGPGFLFVVIRPPIPSDCPSSSSSSSSSLLLESVASSQTLLMGPNNLTKLFRCKYAHAMKTSLQFLPSGIFILSFEVSPMLYIAYTVYPSMPLGRLRQIPRQIVCRASTGPALAACMYICTCSRRWRLQFTTHAPRWHACCTVLDKCHPRGSSTDNRSQSLSLRPAAQAAYSQPHDKGTSRPIFSVDDHLPTKHWPGSMIALYV